MGEVDIFFQIIPLTIAFYFASVEPSTTYWDVIFGMYIEVMFFETKELGDWIYLPYIYWSFWIITFLRWITTGKHFWQ